MYKELIKQIGIISISWYDEKFHHTRLTGYMKKSTFSYGILFCESHGLQKKKLFTFVKVLNFFCGIFLLI